MAQINAYTHRVFPMSQFIQCSPVPCFTHYQFDKMAAFIEFVMLLCSFYRPALSILYIDSYMIDDSSGLGRTFDGIGGISGGGVMEC